MPYTPWSVIDGETSTHTKLNQLGANDAGFVDGTNFSDDILKSNHFADNAVWKRIGEAIAAGGETNLVANLTETMNTLRVIMYQKVSSPGNWGSRIRFNNDGSNNYSYRIENDWTNVTSISNFSGFGFGTQTTQGIRYADLEIDNLLNREKLVKMNGQYNNDGVAAGASYAPHDNQLAAKWTNETDLISAISLNSGVTGMDTGSGIIVFGRD